MNKIKTLKLNVFTSIIPWTILAIIGFVKIRLFIDAYGDEVNGFIQLITQIYAYLGLVEMGFGSAIIFRLYKPLALGDKEAVCRLVNGSKKTYRSIAVKLCSLAVVTAFVLPFFIEVKTLSNAKMIAIFLLFAIDYFAKYIFDLPYRALLYADQKKYKANIIINSATLIVKTIELLLILAGVDYILVLISNIVFNTISYIIFYMIVKKEYKWLNITDKADISTREMSKDIMGHKISRLVFYNTNSIIISMTKNLGMVATSIFGSYNYIITAIRNVLEMFFSSPLEILGNKFAKDENKKNEAESLYNEILSATYFVGVLICGVYFVAMNKLAEVWINKGYVLDNITMLIFTLYIWYECVGRTNLTMIEANGKYKETKNIEFICAGLNIVLAIILARFFGIAGVMGAAVISLAFVRHPLQTRFLHKHIFNSSMKKPYLKFIANIIVMFALCIVNYFGVSLLSLYQNMNFITWGITTFIIALVDAIIMFILYMIFDNSFRKMVKRFIRK